MLENIKFPAGTLIYTRSKCPERILGHLNNWPQAYDFQHVRDDVAMTI